MLRIIELIDPEKENETLVDKLDNVHSIMSSFDANDIDYVNGLLITKGILSYPIVNKKYNVNSRILKADKVAIMENIVEQFSDLLASFSPLDDSSFSDKTDFFHDFYNAVVYDITSYVNMMCEQKDRYFLMRETKTRTKMLSPLSKKGHKDIIALMAFYFNKLAPNKKLDMSGKSFDDDFKRIKFFIENINYDHPQRINSEIHKIFEIEGKQDSSRNTRLVVEYTFLSQHLPEVFDTTKRYFML